MHSLDIMFSIFQTKERKEGHTYISGINIVAGVGAIVSPNTNKVVLPLIAEAWLLTSVSASGWVQVALTASFTITTRKNYAHDHMSYPQNYKPELKLWFERNTQGDNKYKHIQKKRNNK